VTKSKPWWWFLRNWQGWTLLALGVAAAFVTHAWWVALLGVIGHLLVLVVDLAGSGLDRNAYVRLAQAEQENRAMSAERARLLGGLKESQARHATLDASNEQLRQELQAAQAEIERLKAKG
jgi:hypothetical protein